MEKTLQQQLKEIEEAISNCDIDSPDLPYLNKRYNVIMEKLSLQ